MTEYLSVTESPAALDREKALAFAAVAAVSWCEHRSGVEIDGATVLRALMNAAAWSSRSRAHDGQPAVPIHKLIDLFNRPVGDWLPGGPRMVLVEDGEPTPLCEEMAADAGAAPSMEVEQRVLLRAMDHVGIGTDASAKYTAFRRFLVEHASARQVEAARIARSVGLDLAELYQEVSTHAVTAVDGTDCFYPCPRCRWPMKVTETRVRCALSSPCRQAGATFSRTDDGLLALGKLPAPAPVPVAGWAALRQGVWRYTTLPGLEELDLERRLVELGADIELWPFVDRYDLDVRRGVQHWRVDVKDHASVPRLARHLADKPAPESIWIVVPDHKRDQVAMLRSLVPADLGYRFASSSEFVRLVEAGQ